jgi:alpha-glucosidase
MNLNKAIFFLRASGLRSALRTLRYSRRRDRLDREYAANYPKTPFQGVGELLKVDPTAAGACFTYQRAELEVLFLAHDLVRVSWKPGIEPLPYALENQEWPQVDVRLAEAKGKHYLYSGVLETMVSEGGALLFKDSQGRYLRQEQPPEYQGTEKEDFIRWRQRACLGELETIYGLGERAAPLDRRGGSYRMWNTDPGGSYGPGKDPLYITIPAYLSMHNNGSYLIFYENSFPATFKFGSKEIPADTSQVEFEGGMLRYYLMPGPPDIALERYTELTGRAPLPPRWALGYHQSRWGYKTEADIREVAAGFRENDLPLSAIHLDIDYMDGYRIFTVNRRRFPDLNKLTQDLERQGIKTVAIIDPAIKIDRKYKQYQECLEGEIFCKDQDGKVVEGLVWPGWSAYPDFTNPATRAWWGQQYPRLLNQGIAGIWHDMNEPTAFTAWEDMTLPLQSRHDLEGTQGDHRQAHNLYGLLMNQAGYEALRSLRPGRRPWLLTRSGWAGLQRYAWTWTGDTESSWDALRMTIPTVLGLGLSGLPFSGPDVGGFSGEPSEELYVRWFQMASFLPFFRTHSAIGIPRREPWMFGDRVLNILREFLNMREQLIPYHYGLAWEASQKGHPPVRPLFWLDPTDQALWKIEDAFLLGDSLLIAPMLEEGQEQRSFHLPAGGWYNFWDDRYLQGPGEITLQAGLERIPILVRAGSVLPVQQSGSFSLHLYPPVGEAGAGFLYSDEGDGYGAYRLDRFSFSQNEDGLLLKRSWEGNYPFPYTETSLELHAVQAKRIFVDGKELKQAGPIQHVLLENFQQVLFKIKTQPGEPDL